MAEATTVAFDFDAVTTRMLIDFKRETGASLLELVDEETGALNLDGVAEEVVGGVIWLGLRMSGRPDATYDEALDIPVTALDFTEEDAVDPQ